MNLYGPQKDQQRIGFKRELDTIYRQVQDTWIGSRFTDINLPV